MTKQKTLQKYSTSGYPPPNHNPHSGVLIHDVPRLGFHVFQELASSKFPPRRSQYYLKRTDPNSGGTSEAGQPRVSTQRLELYLLSKTNPTRVTFLTFKVRNILGLIMQLLKTIF